MSTNKTTVSTPAPLTEDQLAELFFAVKHLAQVLFNYAPSVQHLPEESLVRLLIHDLEDSDFINETDKNLLDLIIQELYF